MAASRFNRKDKQRKVNKVYNISITVVSLLIVVVAITIFFGKNDMPKTETASSESGKAKQSEETNKEASKENEDEKEPSETTDEEDLATAEEGQSESDADSEEEVNADQEATEIELTEGETEEPKVGEPVGTAQTGKHTTSFEKGSADWNEMTHAMASGTGLDPANMTIWWLGNGGAPNKAVGTVSAKNDSKKYKVHMEWVDGAGWKPVKVE